MLDYYINLITFNVFFFNEWSKFFFSSHDASIFYLYHPEAMFFLAKTLNFSYKYSTDFFLTILNNNNIEVFFSPIISVVEIFFFFFLITVFISFYFSNFLSMSKEETLIDNDYLLSSAFVESEKEISSVDDIILVLISFIFIFGWYFYINFISILNKTPELFLIFYFLPLAYFVIFGIPTFLMFDFGIFFLVYLKGVGSYSNLLIEAMFDYINVVIFYTRILVQGIRLVLMLFTYLSMNDLVLYFSFNQTIFLNYENIWETKNSSFFLLDNFTYFLFFSLPAHFLYWIYEILHTYFVVTVQFSAFFAIVFWLFLFLYTFFVIEKQENYFSEKRIKKKKQLLSLLNLKNYKNKF